MIVNTIINDKYLKEFSPIPLNYNMKELHNYTKLAEDVWIRPLIGDDWYAELIEQVKTNTLTEANSTALIEAIWPYLAYAVCLEALPIIWAHFSETGISLGKSDNSDSIDLKDMTYIQQHLRSQTELRKDICKKWICDHSASFPLVDCCACECDCCQEGKLNHPNPWNQLYRPKKKNTDLK